MNLESKVAIISITNRGKNLALTLKKHIPHAHLYVLEKISDENTMSIDGSFIEFVSSIFNKYDHFVFIMATGIVVRAISQSIIDKTCDPSVVVIDELGQNVISLLSGHLGGANEMALSISKFINANPVITTATDVNNKSAFDMICKKLDAYVDDFKENIKLVNSALVHDDKVGLYIDGNYDVDTRGFEVVDSIDKLNKFKVSVLISNKNNDGIDDKIIKIIPKDIVVSIGCRKNTKYETLKSSIDDFFTKNNISEKSIKCIASVDVKKDEKAIKDLARYLGVDFKIVSRQDIKKVEHLFEKSKFVKKSIGVYSVAEPVNYILSDEIIINKTKYTGITFCVGRIDK